MTWAIFRIRMYAIFLDPHGHHQQKKLFLSASIYQHHGFMSASPGKEWDVLKFRCRVFRAFRHGHRNDYGEAKRMLEISRYGNGIQWGYSWILVGYCWRYNIDSAGIFMGDPYPTEFFVNLKMGDYLRIHCCCHQESDEVLEFWGALVFEQIIVILQMWYWRWSVLCFGAIN